MIRSPWIVLAGALLLAGPVMAETKEADSLAQGLQQSIAAVFDPGTPAARIMLLETDHDVQGSRTLWIGDQYRDGWRLASVGNGQAVLRRGRQTMTVGLNAAWPAPPPVEAQSLAMATGALPSLSNALTPTGDRQTILARAINTGQPMQVYQMNGSGKDIAQALARGLSRSGQAGAGAQLNTLAADRNVSFNVNVDDGGTSLIARRNGQEVGRFASPLLDMARMQPSPMIR